MMPGNGVPDLSMLGTQQHVQQQQAEAFANAFAHMILDPLGIEKGGKATILVDDYDAVDVDDFDMPMAIVNGAPKIIGVSGMSAPKVIGVSGINSVTGKFAAAAASTARRRVFYPWHAVQGLSGPWSQVQDNNV